MIGLKKGSIIVAATAKDTVTLTLMQGPHRICELDYNSAQARNLADLLQQAAAAAETKERYP